MTDKTGIMIATALGGGVLLWSGISNKGVLVSARDLLQGNRPAPGGPQQFSLSLGSLGSSSPAVPGGPAGNLPPLINPSVSAAQANAKLQMAAYGWTSQAEIDALIKLWNGESGWKWDATNPSSGAYGIPQALPGSKMASAGADWQTNVTTQIKWGLKYIHDVYGSPSATYQKWLSRNPHWY